MLEGATCVVRRVDEYALDLPCEFLLQGLQRQQVVPEDEAVVEVLVLRPAAARGVVGELGVFEEDARLQAGALVLADPGELQLGLLGHRTAVRVQRSLAEPAAVTAAPSPRSGFPGTPRTRRGGPTS